MAKDDNERDFGAGGREGELWRESDASQRVFKSAVGVQPVPYGISL